MSVLEKYKNGYWIGGVLTALSGALAVRFVGPSIADERYRAAVVIAGQLCALLGLFVIALGVRKRLKVANEDFGSGQAELQHPESGEKKP